MKKYGLYDEVMEVYDEAELCELVGIFFLVKISEKYDRSNIDLRHKNGLSVFTIKTVLNVKE